MEPKKLPIEIDLSKDAILPIKELIQQDTNILEFTVKNNGVDADLSTVGRIVVNYRRPDKKTITRYLKPVGNVLTYELGYEENQLRGEGKIDIQFFSLDNTKRLSKKDFRIYLASTVGNELAIENEPQYTVLQDLFIETDQLRQDTETVGSYAQEQAEFAKAQAENAKNESSNLNALKQTLDSKINDAQGATDAANTAATNANQKATTAQTQADYAKTQGDRAKAEADRLVGTNVSVLDNKITAIDTRLTSGLAEKAKQSDLNATNVTVASKANQSDLITTNNNVSATNTRVDQLVINSGNANAEVTDSHVSTVKNKTFTTLRNRLEESEKEISQLRSIENIATNGDFSDGLTGWAINAGAPIISTDDFYSSPQSLKCFGTSAQIKKDLTAVVGHKYYVSLRAKCTRFVSGILGYVIGGVYNGVSVVNNSFALVSEIHTITAANTSFVIGSLSGANLDGYIDDVLIVNLSLIYGVGKEPTKEEFEKLLTNAWNGKTLNTALLYNHINVLKANAADYRAINIKNIATNGNFNSGLNGWTLNAGTPTVSTDAFYSSPQSLKCFGATSQQMKQNITTVVGHKYYVGLRAKCTRFTKGLIGYKFDTTKPDTYQCLISTSNDFVLISNIHEATAALATLLVGSFDGANLDGYIDDVIVVNLTETFGQGKEPRLSDFNKIIKYFYESIFNPSLNIANNDYLFKELANRNPVNSHLVKPVMELYKKTGVPKFSTMLTASSVYTMYDSLVTNFPEYVSKTLLGNESTGLPIYQYTFKPFRIPEVSSMYNGATASYINGNIKTRKIVMIGGVHGGEQQAVLAIYNFFNSLCSEWKTSEILKKLRWNLEIVIIPVVNPSGLGISSRFNANGKELNRYFPMSELEHQYLQSFINNNVDADFFIDIHNTGIALDTIDDLSKYAVTSISTNNRMVKNIGANVVSALDIHWRDTYPEVLTAANNYFTTKGKPYPFGFIAPHIDTTITQYVEDIIGIKSLLIEFCQEDVFNGNVYGTSLVMSMSQEVLGNMLSALIDNI